MQDPKPLGSVVIPAHNEATVVERCLNALLDGFQPGELDVVVVCNGCSDDTAVRARRSWRGLRVIELNTASKPAALRRGDAETDVLPRLYVDADVVLPGASARAVLKRLGSGAVAARPPIRYDSGSASAPVRSYYRARARVPSVMGSLWGAGVYGLSEDGRRRFEAFPDKVPDDLWVDQLFEAHEVEIVECDPVVVAVPRRARDLVRVMRRAHRGKSQTASHLGERTRPDTTRSTLRGLLRVPRAGPAAALDALTYAGFAASVRLALALVPGTGGDWERDDSSRAV